MSARMSRNTLYAIISYAIIFILICCGLFMIGLVYMWPTIPQDNYTRDATLGEALNLVICRPQASQYFRKIRPIVNEFLDSAILAGAISKLSAGPFIKDMQAARRKFDDVAPPACVRDSADQISTGMNDIITNYLTQLTKFTEEPDEHATTELENAFRNIADGITRLRISAGYNKPS